MAVFAQKLVSSLLKKYLGQYVEGLQEEDFGQLKNGNLTLSNLKIKRSVFDDLELPLVIQKGSTTKIINLFLQTTFQFGFNFFGFKLIRNIKKINN